MLCQRKLRTNICVPIKNEVKHLRNDSILKEVYRHALPEVQKKMENKALKYFEKMQHKVQVFYTLSSESACL
ncbi:hypothetical protein DWX08_06490 [Ruminococcus sp. AF18-22]|nr:hypothetical protein DWX08_06490 [Ruminococcus sp. AF18-22]